MKFRMFLINTHLVYRIRITRLDTYAPGVLNFLVQWNTQGIVWSWRVSNPWCQWVKSMDVGSVLNTWRLEGWMTLIFGLTCRCWASRDGCKAMKQEGAGALTVLIRSYKEVQWSPPFGTPAARHPLDCPFQGVFEKNERIQQRQFNTRIHQNRIKAS